MILEREFNKSLWRINNEPEPLIGQLDVAVNLANDLGNSLPEQVPAGETTVRGGSGITTSSLRVRGVRSRPQAYEGDIGRLRARLLGEGADVNTVALLHSLIFAEGVTRDALMAPTMTSGVFHGCNGASKMWKMLLETKEVIPGEKKYCCLLCPLENRREYRHSRDALQHFNRDHFGFSFPCSYW